MGVLISGGAIAAGASAGHCHAPACGGRCSGKSEWTGFIPGGAAGRACVPCAGRPDGPGAADVYAP
jgi:hypothetical protein